MVFILLMLIMTALSWTMWGCYISKVSVSPANPPNTTPMMVVVEGSVPAMNYRLNGTDFRRLANALLLDMYWKRTGYGGVALAPYRYKESIGSVSAGQYTVTVRSICDGLTRETQTISFTVSSRVDVQPTVWPSLARGSLPWQGTDNSVSGMQTQSTATGNGSISPGVPFSSGTMGQ